MQCGVAMNEITMYAKQMSENEKFVFGLVIENDGLGQDSDHDRFRCRWTHTASVHQLQSKASEKRRMHLREAVLTKASVLYMDDGMY